MIPLDPPGAIRSGGDYSAPCGSKGPATIERVPRFPAISIALIVASTLGLTPQPPPTLDTVVARVSRFARQQRDALSNVRADEHYVQSIELDLGRVRERRTLVSEMAFARLSGREDWVAFRNVVRVDDEPTGTDPARLEKLFREGDAASQGSRIVRESAMHNLGGLERNLNTPVMVMHLLMPGQVERFKFKKEGEESRSDERVWILSLRETARPTVVRSVNRADVPINGRLWIVPETGVLTRALLETDRPVRSQLEFLWRLDAKLEAWVPAEMRERYRRVLDPDPQRKPYDIVGLATYSNYRRFAVDVRIK